MDLPDITQATNKTLAILRGSGAVGYSDTLSITWDGNPEGKTIAEAGELRWCKVSDKVLTAADVIGSTVTMFDINLETQLDTFTFTEGDLIWSESGAIISEFLLSGLAGTYNADGEEFVVPESGTYFTYVGGDLWIKSITKETLHPIDPKYLPGVCLPVVELSMEYLTQIAEGIAQSQVGKYGDVAPGAVASVLESAIDMKVPCIASAHVDDGEISFIVTDILNARGELLDDSNIVKVYGDFVILGMSISFHLVNNIWHTIAVSA